MRAAPIRRARYACVAAAVWIGLTTAASAASIEVKVVVVTMFLGSCWTKRKGNFVTSAMEDSGTLVSLNYLSRTGKVDKRRALVLRTASNYTMQPPGLTVAQNMVKENEGYSGLSASVESAYKVGSAVVNEILNGWSTYRDHPPAAPRDRAPSAAAP